MYRAPVDEISHALKHVAGLNKAIEDGRFEDLSEDLVDAILTEAGRFASDEIAPLDEGGDTNGARLENGAVTTAPGWQKLYKDWTEGGWNALTGPSEFGGQDLPIMMSVAAFEMWNSGSLGFAIGPTLTVGAVEAIEKHADAALKAIYLEKMVSGEWTGTMNLTEPQAGSDLGALKTRAEPVGDGSYRIFGQKIFITYGEHDLTDNIVHLVLARLPDAPAGTRGISLFLVPKFLVNDDGSLGARNDLQCVGLEHKLGIHASPTCTMVYGDGSFGDTPGAIGWLVGEENKGLACMFTMMNNARLHVGIQGVSAAEAAYQKALEYARERTQGRAPGHKGEGMSPIIEHPDVQRMLLTMKALTGAARAICYACAHAIDMSHASEGEAAGTWSERAGILTPIAKAFSTDIGVEVASLGVQCHGGMGFIEETGAARYFRDSRIAPIYEGTNGIQAIDLVTRKLPLSDGGAVAALIAEYRDDAEAVRASNRDGLEGVAERLDAALDNLEATTGWLTEALQEGRKAEALAGATPYLRLFGLVAGGAYLARGAIVGGDGDDAAAATRAALARFAATNLLPETASLRATVTGGSDTVAAAASAVFG
ncbi:acyl-CoA dehydrogenase [Pseudohoeflea coraliihabitans]|uniref:Acyl-CoA dehydrogenase n=1 Tax=Pseudohoeflea coraliihabitans TaxID=2860393 RepID=A0ABS6WLY3_9HYPH|nr:acyl-CoA dehydrogenase [Pseudohoeflea sp. DP4N28-3]MBW3096958.1 acyl-CoA dehydrogenase [Pseudohoeflea sp. DP4N28-3]